MPWILSTDMHFHQSHLFLSGVLFSGHFQNQATSTKMLWGEEMPYISRHTDFLVFTITDDKYPLKGGEMVVQRILNKQFARVLGNREKSGGLCWVHFGQGIEVLCQKVSSYLKWRIGPSKMRKEVQHCHQ